MQKNFTPFDIEKIISDFYEYTFSGLLPEIVKWKTNGQHEIIVVELIEEENLDPRLYENSEKIEFSISQIDRNLISNSNELTQDDINTLKKIYTEHDLEKEIVILFLIGNHYASYRFIHLPQVFNVQKDIGKKILDFDLQNYLSIWNSLTEDIKRNIFTNSRNVNESSQQSPIKTIRTVDPNNVNHVENIKKLCEEENFYQPQLLLLLQLRAISPEKVPFFLAEYIQNNNASPAGFCVFNLNVEETTMTSEQTVEILYMYVSTHFRRKLFGTFMFKTILNKCTQKVFVLKTLPKIQSIAFWKRNGFGLDEIQSQRDDNFDHIVKETKERGLDSLEDNEKWDAFKNVNGIKALDDGSFYMRYRKK